MTFDYGKPISVELSEYLKDFTDKEDIADVSTNTGISISTIEYVRNRKNTVTENNSVGIIELMKIAIQNAQNNIIKSKNCEADLTEMLDLI